MTWFQDLRYAMRQLRKSPSFAIIAVITLAMAIGANAVVFGVMNGLILRPLDVPNAKSLYEVQRGSRKDFSQSYPDFLDLRDRNHTFDDMVVFGIPQVSLDTGSGPSAVYGMETSANYFDAMRVQPYLGRFFHPSDEHGPNSAPYIVLSYAYWHSHFHDDRSVLGRTVRVNRHPFTIIGVAPPGFRGTLVFFSSNFFLPVVDQEQIDGQFDLNDRASTDFFLLGHLKPGVAPAQAVADLNSIGLWLGKTYPRQDAGITFSLGNPGLFGDQFTRPIKEFLAGLLLLAALILLAACANLGSLFAARAADRSREIALRLALGSSRQRILRGLFTEAVLISIIGGIVGLWVSSGLLRWLADWQIFGNFTIHAPVNPDATVYTIALLLTLLSGFLFGAVPVRQVLQSNPYEVVKSGTTGIVGRRFTAREILLAVQIAICAVLVTSSLVAVRGLVKSLHGKFGFDPNHSMLVQIDWHMAGYTGDRLSVAQKNMLDAVKAIPGVEAAGLTDGLPLDYATDTNVFTDKTADLRASNAAASAVMYHVSPEYLQAEGTSLLAGRNLTPNDDKDSPHVAIVNREFARRIFGSEQKALGGDFKMPDGTRVQIVGITEDGKYGTLTEDPHPALFLPILQWPSGAPLIVIRSSRDPQQLTSAIRNALQKLDPGLPVSIESRYDELGLVLFGPKMATYALGVLGVMGAMLSITGIFGMAAYSVSKRLRELGMRVALGAQRMEVLQAALGRAFRLLAIGSAAGLLLGLLATRVLAYVVYEATPRDPLVLAGVVLAMALVGLVAAWIPAQRALSVDPAILLRAE